MDSINYINTSYERTIAVEEYKQHLRNNVLEEMGTVDLYEMKYYSRFLRLIYETDKKEEGESID